jgi:HTH-type transcriptional regulator/antitoxin HigA
MSDAVLESIPASKAKPAPDYLALVGKFPLRAIRNGREHDAALAVLDKLAGRPGLTKGEQEYLDALTSLVERYESDDAQSAGDEPVSPLEMLKALMEHRGVGQRDVAHVLGSESAASMILNGKRQISKSQAKALAAYFRVDVGAFI